MEIRMHLANSLRLTAFVLPLFAACSGGSEEHPDTRETSDTTDTAEEVVETSRCDPARPPIMPVGTDDVRYTSVAAYDCLERPCLCDEGAAVRLERVLACDAVGVGWYEPFGSFYLEVVGREEGACLIDVAHETEGGVGVSRCALPLPIAPWPGLAGVLDDADMSDPLEGIAERCARITSCCILPGCPTPCEADVPLCPMGRVDPCAP